MFQDQSWDPIWPRGLVVRGAAEGLLHNCKSDMSGDHRYGRSGAGRTRSSQGNGASGGSVGLGERATVSICASFVTTPNGVAMGCPVVLSFKIERSIGSVVEALAPVAARRMDLGPLLVYSQTCEEGLSLI